MWIKYDSNGLPLTQFDANNPSFTGILTFPAMVGLIGAVTAAHTGVACPLTYGVIEVTTDGDSDEDNLTVANGTPGQIIEIVCKAVGNAADTLKITPATLLGGTDIKFLGSPIGSGVRMEYTSAGWCITGRFGTQFEVGTTVNPPAQFRAGTNLTTAQAGASEYDGVAHYLTSVAGNRGVNALMHFTSQNANWNGTNVATAQPVFATDRDVITLPAATTFMFEAVYKISTTGATSHQIGTLFAFSSAPTSIGYFAAASQAATDIQGAYTGANIQVATVVYLTPALASATFNSIHLQGIFRTNLATTLTPQFQFSAAPGVAPIIYANSFIRLMPVGSNTVIAVGSIA